MSVEIKDEARALADRCVNYADALAAIAYLGATGATATLADPDTRESLNQAGHWITLGHAIVAVAISVVLYFLRRWELDLRSASAQEPKIQRYSRYFYIARHCVVWLAVVQLAVALQAISSGG